MGNDKKIGGIPRLFSRGTANKRIIEKQKLLGRKLTKEEKEDIRQDCARDLRNKFIAVGVAVSTFITGFGAGVATERLNAGDEPDGVEVTTKADKDDGNKDDKDWTSTIKVDISTPTPDQSKDKELEQKRQQIKNEIAGLDSKEDVLNHLKQQYAKKYKEITGKSISASSIKITLTNQSYVYQLEDGTIVTHGDYPTITESQIAADGIAYERAEGRKVYIVKDSFGNDLDGMGIYGGKVIPGNSYDKLKDSQSVLEAIESNVINCYFRAIDLMNQLDNKPGNDHLESLVAKALDDLVEAQLEQYEASKQQGQVQQAQQATTRDNVASNQTNKPIIDDDGRG